MVRSRVAVLVIFGFTYVLIAAQRLSFLPIGRPAGAMVGACAMVALFALTGRFGLSPEEAFAAVEPNTIALLLGMMLLTAALGEAGFFELGASWLTARQLSPAGLLYVVTIGAGLLSALLVNDSVCLLLGPLVSAAAVRAGRGRAPYLLGLAMGSNAGSALTLAGNPQNMLVAHLSGLTYRQYFAKAGLPAMAGLLVTAGVVHWACRAELRAPSKAPLLVAIDPGAAKPRLLAVAWFSVAVVSICSFPERTSRLARWAARL